MKILTQSPSEFLIYVKDKNISKNYYQTGVGALEILSFENKIFQVNFTHKFLEDKTFNIKDFEILLIGTDFQITVWKEIINISAGTTQNYQEIAINLGYPKSYRAVANALSKNKIAYFIPCHRIIGKGGNMQGYKWGIEKKKALLEYEAKNTSIL